MMKLEKDKNNAKKVRIIRLLNINKIEYFVLEGLRKYPKFRNFIKFIYQRSIYLATKIFDEDVRNKFDSEVVGVTSKERSIFSVITIYPHGILQEDIYYLWRFLFQINILCMGKKLI